MKIVENYYFILTLAAAILEGEGKGLGNSLKPSQHFKKTKHI